jgi:3-hydroxybutyryl-CoA dehydrogenase
VGLFRLRLSHRLDEGKQMSKVNPHACDAVALAALIPAPGMARPAVPAENDHPSPVRRVGVVGANATGVCIAMDLLDAGIPVTVFELDRSSLDAGITLARAGFQHAVAQGALTAGQRDRRMSLLAGTVNLHHLKDCDLIIDAVFTDLVGKEKLFRRLDEFARPGAILMSCASHLDVSQLAGFTRRPGEVLGLRFPSGAQGFDTWEFVCGKRTTAETLATATALSRTLREAALASGACDGAAHDRAGVARHPEQGSGSWQIDRAEE